MVQVLMAGPAAASCRQAVSVKAPSSLDGGDSATATVLLRCRLGAHGTSVKLASSSAWLTTAQTVWVPRRSTSARFTIHTSAPAWSSGANWSATATLTASLQKSHGTATLTILPHEVITFFGLSPNDIVGGNAGCGRIVVSGPVGSPGLKVTLTPGDKNVSVPSTVTVPGGTTSVTFPFTTKVITSPSADATSVSIRTVISGVTQKLSWPLTITPVRPGVSGVSFLEPNGKSYVRPGHGANGTVGLTGPAPTSGVVVKLTTDNPDLVVPATFTMPAGYCAFDFPITASSQGLRTTATVTASANNLASTMSIGLLPNGNLERIFRPTEGASQYVAYGTSIDELLALSYPQPTDTVVTLTSSDPRVIMRCPDWAASGARCRDGIRLCAKR